MSPWNDIEQPGCRLYSRYALGRDYHKVLRKRLQKLAQRIEQEVGIFGYRAFVDSAPVLEKAIAEKAGLGWIGKHSNIINKKQGHGFFWVRFILHCLYLLIKLVKTTAVNA